MKSIWNDELIQKLKDCWEKGLTTSEIGKILGVTKNSVIGKVHRLNLEKRPSCIIHRDKNSESKKTIKIKDLNNICVKSNKKVDKPQIEEDPVEGKKSKKVIKLLDLEHNMCHWPVGDPKHSDFHFCGNKTKEGKIYCDFHRALAYVHCTNGK